MMESGAGWPRLLWWSKKWKWNFTLINSILNVWIKGFWGVSDQVKENRKWPWARCNHVKDHRKNISVVEMSFILTFHPDHQTVQQLCLRLILLCSKGKHTLSEIAALASPNTHVHGSDPLLAPLSCHTAETFQSLLFYLCHRPLSDQYLWPDANQSFNGPTNCCWALICFLFLVNENVKWDWHPVNVSISYKAERGAVVCGVAPIPTGHYCDCCHWSSPAAQWCCRDHRSDRFCGARLSVPECAGATVAIVPLFQFPTSSMKVMKLTLGFTMVIILQKINPNLKYSILYLACDGRVTCWRCIPAVHLVHAGKCLTPPPFHLIVVQQIKDFRLLFCPPEKKTNLHSCIFRTWSNLSGYNRIISSSILVKTHLCGVQPELVIRPGCSGHWVFSQHALTHERFDEESPWSESWSNEMKP